MSFVTDALGSLVGIKSHDQRVSENLQNQSQAQSAEASGLRQNAQSGYNNAANQYGNIGNEGSNLFAQFNANSPGLVNQFKTASGLNDISDTNGYSNPYGLTQAQQTLLNGQVDTINKQKQTAINNLHASLAQKGIDDPRYAASAEANINSLYGSMANQHQANFAEQARQQRQQAAQSLLGYYQGVGNAGTGLQEAGAGGQLNVSGGLGNLANGAQGASVQSNNQAQQLQQQQNAIWNNLLGIGSFALGGGFGGGGGNNNGGASVPMASPYETPQPSTAYGSPSGFDYVPYAGNFGY